MTNSHYILNIHKVQIRKKKDVHPNRKIGKRCRQTIHKRRNITPQICKNTYFNFTCNQRNVN